MPFHQVGNGFLIEQFLQVCPSAIICGVGVLDGLFGIDLGEVWVADDLQIVAELHIENGKGLSMGKKPRPSVSTKVAAATQNMDRFMPQFTSGSVEELEKLDPAGSWRRESDKPDSPVESEGSGG